MRTEVSNRFIATFPVAGTARAFMRRIRLGLLGCPVYFYRAQMVDQMLREAGWRSERVERIGQLLRISAATTRGDSRGARSCHRSGHRA